MKFDILIEKYTPNESLLLIESNNCIKLMEEGIVDWSIDKVKSAFAKLLGVNIANLSNGVLRFILSKINFKNMKFMLEKLKDLIVKKIGLSVGLVLVLLSMSQPLMAQDVQIDNTPLSQSMVDSIDSNGSEITKIIYDETYPGGITELKKATIVLFGSVNNVTDRDLQNRLLDLATKERSDNDFIKGVLVDYVTIAKKLQKSDNNRDAVALLKFRTMIDKHQFNLKKVAYAKINAILKYSRLPREAELYFIK